MPTFVQNFVGIGQAVQKLQPDHYQITVFRCNLSVSCIISMYSISKTAGSIALKLCTHAHWHVLRHWLNFRREICGSFRNMRNSQLYAEGWKKMEFFLLFLCWAHQCRKHNVRASLLGYHNIES